MNIFRIKLCIYCNIMHFKNIKYLLIKYIAAKWARSVESSLNTPPYSLQRDFKNQYMPGIVRLDLPHAFRPSPYL